MSLALNKIAKRTFFFERLRAIGGGILETAGTTFLLLIAVKAFDASALEKSLLAISVSGGLLLSPLVLGSARRLGLSPSRAAALISFVAGLLLLFPAFVPNKGVFVLCTTVAFASLASVVPLLTQIFQENYPESVRGSLFSATVIWRIVAAALFAFVAGKFLNLDIGSYPVVLLAFALASLFSGYCLWQTPTQRLPALSPARHPWVILKSDPLFRLTLAAWMLMGFANLFMIPLRVEYLASEHYEIRVDPATVALLTGVLPNASRLLMSRVWGILFDKLNFFFLRIVLNTGFMVGILAFFLGNSLPSLVIGALIFGISVAGGDIAWSLWVTKVAPADKVADYMAVHTLLTGLRGVVAPFLAFQLVLTFHPSTLAWGCAGLIAVASAMLVPEARSVWRRRAATPLTPTGEER